MMSGLGRGLGALALVFSASVAGAQDNSSTARVDAMTDWSVFEEASPRECWAVTTYKESVNTKDGRVVAVTRGEILLMVFFRPEAGVSGQIAFTGGYPFAKGSTVNVTIGDSEFELYTEGEWAWPATPQDDTKIITAMKRGADAVLSAVSSRGTATKDTFSLLGFTAAYEDAEKRCS
ncbi:invasion associated locus B family protein [Mameliella sediminis]|uniref:invasion associated locus B family protein n=1 Tax=Mameliella sediminis TaxID=2836866 RepID=UPI001C454FAA|nr:invasion associated locus B family protein [Mameliella sediminis]MBY6114211.1 invasion associated locus B family protein [Antarctobacter heliothermus]MBY6142441.1 invasion associated locus B family protein [Mameliella alba]MBV7395508.1 invasion associated locus B family protein [Mameliella sediminis]MBY6159269.1 invasion associated locus B family protein [Mameliella alba]MBY6167740.1 invasion associated locus B family protein [Mameliella alba]